MCEYVGMVEALSRRALLKRGAMAGAAVGAVTLGIGCSDGNAAAPGTTATDPSPVSPTSLMITTAEAVPTTTTPASTMAASTTSMPTTTLPAERYNTRVVLLGTAGGPRWFPGDKRAGISSAVVVGDATYLVDCGDGWGRRYEQAGLYAPPPNLDFNNLRGVFLTHLHSDHVVGYPSLLLFGFPGSPPGTVPTTVHVYGPGRRGGLPDPFPPSKVPSDPVAPDLPDPGTQDMTDLLTRAFATDFNDRSRDGNAPDIRLRLVAHDIPLPPGVGIHSQPVAPFDVYEDDRVKVTATLVDHGQVFPTFGYRFDTDDGSVTFSGDTAVSENLIELARDTDVLVHEVIDLQWVRDSFAGADVPAAILDAITNHLVGAHTSIEQVGPLAERAGARMLVLSHLVPANNSDEVWAAAQAGFSGQFSVGADLMDIGVGAPL